MDNAHIATMSPPENDTAPLDDPFDRALQELARAGIAFEILSEAGPWERAA